MRKDKNWEEAKKLNLPHYSTGKPCKCGHMSLRYTVSRICVECSRLIHKHWSKNNKEKKTEHNRKWDSQNRDKRKAFRNDWSKTNKKALASYRKKIVATGTSRAHNAIQRAIRNGVLLSLKEWVVSCQLCKTSRAVGYDHRDYNFPLLVIPVCSACNSKLGKGVPVN